MQDEIDAAYDAARRLLETMHTVSFYRDHPLSMAFPDVDDAAEQWEVMQDAMTKPLQQKRPMPSGLTETVGSLEKQVKNILPVFEQIPENLMRRGYASWRDMELLGRSYRYVRAALYDLGWGLIHWAKRFGAMFCNERAHVLGTIEHDNLRDQRNECPFSEGIYQSIYNRIELEHGQLLCFLPSDSYAKQPAKPGKTKKKPVSELTDAELCRYLTDAKIHSRWEKAKKPDVRTFLAKNPDIHTDPDGFKKLRANYRQRKSSHGYTLQVLQTEHDRRENDFSLSQCECLDAHS